MSIEKNELQNLKELAESIGDHLTQKGWFASSKPVFGDNNVYADNFRGAGKQLICIVPARKKYFGRLHEFIAAANPKTVVALIERIEELEAE